MKTNHSFLRITIVMYLVLCICFFCVAEQKIHVLQKGETLYTLSRKYGVSVKLITDQNNISDPSKLKIGQSLVIPEGSFYEVQKGDTLYSIARKNQVTIDSIIVANKMTKDDASKLKAGSQIFIPAAVVAATKDPESVGNSSSTNTTVTQPVVASVTNLVPITDPRNYTTRKLDTSKIWPVKGSELSYLNGKLYGILITAERGDSVTSIAAGSILSASPVRGFGNVVFVHADNGYIYVYGGLDDIALKPGDRIPFGSTIGSLGKNLIAGKSQVYLMVYKDNKPVDPAVAPRG